MIEVGVLGPVTLWVDGAPTPMGGRKQQRLLAILVAADGQARSPDHLIEHLWQGSPPATAEGTLQTYLTHLRRAFEPDRARGAPSAYLLSDVGGYALALGDEQVDARRFEAAVRAAIDRLDETSAEAVDDELKAALDLWRGPAFGDLASEPFAQSLAVRLEELRLTAIEGRMDARLLAGNPGAVAAELEALVGEHPLREGLWSRLMVALYRSGRQADALRAFQRVQMALVEELGIEPGPELQAIELAILRQDPELLPEPPGARATLRWEPPPLPRPLTRFVGREQDLADLADAVRDHRLTTVSGPGGFGKTRLALALASRVASEGRPVVFADLELAERGNAVPDTIAAAAGLPPPERTSALQNLADRLGGRRALVVLDNAELFVEAAQAAVTTLLAEGDLTVLATSRVPLAVPGELTVPLGPLDVPPPEADKPEAFDAVRLFEDRMAGDADRSDIAALCRAVDGVPLAVELLAARLKVMSIAELSDRVDHFVGEEGADGTTAALEGLLDWTIESLESDHRAVAEAASAFSGTFTLAGLERVVRPDVAGADVPEALAAMIDRSMLSSYPEGERTRYRMSPLIRRRVWSLACDGPDCVGLSRRHATLFAERAETVEQAFGSTDWLAFLEALDADHALEYDQGNFRRALGWAIDTGEVDLALTLTAGIARYWRWRGRLAECRDWLDSSLSLPTPSDLGPTRARLLRERAGLARQSGAWRDALRYGQEAAKAFQQVGDASGLADALYELGWGALLGGDFDEAERLLREAIALRAEAPDRGIASFPMVSLATVRRLRGDTKEAARLWKEALGSNEFVGQTGVEFWRADLLVDGGELDRAEALALACFEKASGLGFDVYRHGARYVLARIAAARGDWERAEVLAESAATGGRAAGAPEIEGFARRLLADISLHRRPLDPSAVTAFAPFAAGFGGALGVAVLSEQRAAFELASDADRALLALTSAASLRSEQGLPLAGPEADWVAERTAAARRAGAVEAPPLSIEELRAFAFG